MAAMLRGRAWGSVFISIGVLLLVAAGAVWLLVPVEYEAYALMRVQSRPPTVLADARDDEEFSVFKRTQVQLILSNVVLTAALRDPAINRLPIVSQQPDDQIAWLRERLKIDYPDDAEIMRITMTSAHPDEAIKIVDKLTDVYLKEIVLDERRLKMENEDKVRRAYETQEASYKHELEALRNLEAIHKTSGSQAAQLKQRMAARELETLVASRNKYRDLLIQVGLEIAVKKAREELAAEKRTAASSQAVEKPREDLPLPVLEAKRKFMEEQLAEMNKAVARKADEVAGLESFSAEVAAKQEDLKALNALLTELRSKLDRAQVERLASERIRLVDRATVADSAGDAPSRSAGILTLAGFGLAFVALGVMLQVESRGATG